MCTLDIMQTLLQEQNKTQKELCDYLGITKGTYSNWKKGLSESYKSYIMEIAEFFGVSTDYLLGKTGIRKGTALSEQPLTAMQEKVINMVLNMTDFELEGLLRLKEAFSKHNENS